MNTTSDGGHQHERGLRGDPGVDRTQEDGTRDQMCKRINQLEAARDHLRARLRLHVEEWQAIHARMQRQRRFEQWESQLLPETVYRLCADTLLAVLTEPQPLQVQEKKDVTRSAETDVNREVPLPQRED